MESQGLIPDIYISSMNGHFSTHDEFSLDSPDFWSMTGWRLGYLAAPHRFAKAAAAIQSQSTSGACSISQHAGVAALGMGNGGGPLVAKMVESFRERRVSLPPLPAFPSLVGQSGQFLAVQ